MIRDARGLQVRHLVADRQRDLAADRLPRQVVAHERPLQHRHRPGQHALHRPLGAATARRPTSATVIGAGRDTSPKMIGGATQREP